MKTRVYCIAVGNGKISAFMPELGANYYCSSPQVVSQLIESMIDDLTPGWGSIKIWVVDVKEENLEGFKSSPEWKG